MKKYFQIQKTNLERFITFLFPLFFLLFLPACSEKISVQFAAEEQTVAKSSGRVSISVNLKRSSREGLGIPFVPTSHINHEVIVPYTVSGTLDYGTQHNLANGKLRISPGASGSNITFTILDASFQGTRTVVLDLGEPSKGILGPSSRHTVILSDGFPTGSIAINNGAAKTNSTAVTLSLSSYGSTEMYVTDTLGCEAGGSWESYRIGKTWPIVNTNSTNTVYVQYRDAAHILSHCYSASILHDDLPPTGGTITIDGGAGTTTSTSVTLTLSAIEASEMYVTNTSGCGGGEGWENYSTIKAWTLGQNNSLATVYVKYRDSALNETSCYSDTITHDNNSPTGGTISINGGGTITNSISATLTLSANGASEMYVTNTSGCGGAGSWEGYSTSKAWTLGQTNATATVYVKYRDSLLNETSCYSDTIVHDNIAPTGGTISIDGGNLTTTSISVTLTLSVNGASEMYVTNTSGCGGGGSWESYSTSKTWTLGQSNSLATVYVKYRDSALNETSCFSDNITHQTFSPTTSGAIAIDGGDRDDHGFASAGADGVMGTVDDLNHDGWLYIAQLVDFAIKGNLNHAPQDILVVGATNDALAAIRSAAVVQGLTVTVKTGAGLQTVNFNEYQLIYVPTDSLNTWGGVSNANLAILKSRKIDIQNFINGGGSLVALSEQEASDPYGWLELPLPFTTAAITGSTLSKTQAAINAGFTISDQDLSNGTPYHNSFTGPPGFNGLVPFVINPQGDIITLGFSSLLYQSKY